MPKLDSQVILASKTESNIISLVTPFLDLVLLILCWFFQKNTDLGTPSKSSGRPNETKSPKWRQQSETKDLWIKQKEALESNLRSRSPFGTSLIDLDSILASFWSLRSQFVAPRDLVIATSKVWELVFLPSNMSSAVLPIRSSSPAESLQVQQAWCESSSSTFRTCPPGN